MQDKLKASEESLVYIFDEVGSEDNNPRELLYVVEQHSNVYICIAVSRSPTQFIQENCIASF